MATRRPLVEAVGQVQEIASGDILPVDVLPPVSAAPPLSLGAGQSYTVADNQQILFVEEIAFNGGEIVFEGGVLVAVA